MNLSRFLPVLPVCLAFSLWADQVQVTSVTATQTQIVVTYTATSAAPCTISVTDNNGGINPPRDVDPALFPNANSDLGRSAANGFRWPTLIGSDGVTRTVVIGGHDETKLASDGRWYTTALQVIEELYKSQTRIYRVREAEERKALDIIRACRSVRVAGSV